MESGSPPRLGWGLKRASNRRKEHNPSRLLQSARDGHPAASRHLTDQIGRSQPTQSALVHRRTMPVSKRCASVYPRAPCRGPQRNPARRPRASNESEPQTRSSTEPGAPFFAQRRVGTDRLETKKKPTPAAAIHLAPLTVHRPTRTNQQPTHTDQVAQSGPCPSAPHRQPNKVRQPSPTASGKPCPWQHPPRPFIYPTLDRRA